MVTAIEDVHFSRGACPGGGWNAGNGLVYGEPLSRHIRTLSATTTPYRTFMVVPR